MKSDLHWRGSLKKRETAVRSAVPAAEAMRTQIRDQLHCGAEIMWTGETDSTNDDARRAALAGQSALSVFGAERQRSGRGRLERRWSSSSGMAVEMSFLFRPQVPVRSLAGFNFAAAIGICRGLELCSSLNAQVKWPNDVLVNGAKICGILSEASILGSHVSFVVTGTGINVNQPGFPPELRGATSLRMLTGRPQARARIAAACIDSVAAETEKFALGGFAAIMDEYVARSAVVDREVEVLSAEGPLAGRCVGFDEEGAIVVDFGGAERHFHANDVSLRGAGLHV